MTAPFAAERQRADALPPEQAALAHTLIHQTAEYCYLWPMSAYEYTELLREHLARLEAEAEGQG